MYTTIVQYAQELGFQSIGWVAIDDQPHLHHHLTQWLDDGCHGDMAWMGRDPHRRADPRAILAHAKTLISVTMNYFTHHTQSTSPAHGRISRYAWGEDYHDVMLPKLRQLMGALQANDPTCEVLAYVDTGPVMEKPWAARAGLGWQGKHTNLIDPKRGSWMFLGEIITTAKLPRAFSVVSRQSSVGGGIRNTEYGIRNTEYGQPSLCGTCTRCIDICPTKAITGPYTLDARRCIAYLTIEHKGSIPEAMRPLLGNHIYGCDLCQDVCPWNRFATPSPEPAFEPRDGNLNPRLIDLLSITDEQFRERFRGSPIKRIQRRRLLRNVAVALGNSNDPAALPALHRALSDTEPLVREHAAWAIAQITSAGESTAIGGAL